MDTIPGTDDMDVFPLIHGYYLKPDDKWLSGMAARSFSASRELEKSDKACAEIALAGFVSLGYLQIRNHPHEVRPLLSVTQAWPIRLVFILLPWLR
jgi:hypothetical protein